MFIVCVVAAAGSLGDYWIASGTHPVYNPNIRPVPMPHERSLHELDKLTERLKAQIGAETQAIVTDCAAKRNTIATLDDWLVKETTKATPDAEMVKKVEAIKANLIRALSKHAELLAEHPELEQRIENERARLKSR